MVMTILEAHVQQDNWPALEEAFHQASQHKDAGLVQTFLLHSARQDDLWRIMTVWESREALNAMRATGETPRGVQIFRSASAEPALSIFEIAGQIPTKSNNP